MLADGLGTFTGQLLKKVYNLAQKSQLQPEDFIDNGDFSFPIKYPDIFDVAYTTRSTICLRRTTVGVIWHLALSFNQLASFADSLYRKLNFNRSGS